MAITGAVDLMAKGRVGGASEWLVVAVAREGEHASHTLEVTMGTLLFVNLHLQTRHKITITVTVIITAISLYTNTHIHTLCPYLCWYVPIRPQVSV